METNNPKDTADRVELRSEKIRNLIGAIPRSLTRWATAVNIIIILAIVLALLLIPCLDGNDKSVLHCLLHLMYKQ